MSAARQLLRRTKPSLPQPHRRWSSSAAAATSMSKKASHSEEHKRNHIYLKPNSFIGSWQTPADPDSANAYLAELQRDYAKQVKDLRKQYMYDMEMQRQDQLRKEAAHREAILVRREERNKSKAAAALARAQERRAFDIDFRHTLMKERQEKLDYWRKREETIQEKANSKKELIRKQSSSWIDEDLLEKVTLERIVDDTFRF